MVHDAADFSNNAAGFSQNNPTVNLRDVRAFSTLNAQTLDELQSITRPRKLVRGAVLFNQTDKTHNVYALQTGGMRLVQYTPDGQAVCLALFAAGDVFGLLEAMQNQPALGTAEAIKDSLLAEIPGEHFHAIVRRQPELSVFVASHLTAYLRSGYDRIRELSTMRVEERIANCVVRLVEKFGVMSENGILIDLPLSRQDVAELVGTRLETVSRVMRGWEKDGLVESKREELCVLKLEPLCEIAGVNLMNVKDMSFSNR